MSSETIDIDEADTDAIQAQIDLSLSFAQDLVSSWVKPSVKLALSKRNDTEKELEEYMRRPPRYVGYALWRFKYYSRQISPQIGCRGTYS
jgi:hypothetical protein